MLNDIKEFGRKATAEHKAKLSAGKPKLESQ
jgi:hypothetical protein